VKGGHTEAVRSLVGKLSSVSALPSRGATAGFGLLYTGYDLDQPQYSSTKARLYINKVFAELKVLFIPTTAHAMSPSALEAWNGTIHILKVFGCIVGASALLNMSVLRHKIAPQDKNDPLLKRAAGHLGSVFTTTSQMLQGIFQLPYLINGQLPTYVTDRLFPKQAGENTLTRKVVYYAFERSRGNVEGIVTMWHHLIWGVVVLGGADSLAVAIQGLEFNNWVFAALSHLPVIGPRAAAAIGDSGAFIDFIVKNILNNIAAWVITGAVQVQSESLMGIDAVARSLVRKEMLAEGKDPGKYSAEFKNRVKEKVEQEKKNKKFPDIKRLRVNLMALYQSALASIGYEVPEEKTLDDYAATSKMGLNVNVLRKAMRKAKALAAQPGSGLAEKQAYQLLRKATRDYSVVSRFIQIFTGKQAYDLAAISNSNNQSISDYVRDVAQSYKSIRKNLVEISLMSNIQNLPETSTPSDFNDLAPKEWLALGQAGAPLATQLVLQGYKEYLYRKAPEAKSDEKTKPQSIDPLENEGAFAKWQLRRAYRRIELALANAGNTITNADRERIYRDELLKASGIFPDYQDQTFIKIVEERTASQWKDRLDEQEFVNALERISNPVEQNRVEQTLRSDIFAQVYRSAAIGEQLTSPTDKLNNMMSPAQPGQSQSLRQTPTVRNSKFLTGLLRLWEAHFSRDHYYRGFYAKVARDVIPFVHHSLAGYTKIWVPLATVLTTEFFIYKYLWHAAPAWSSLLAYKLLYYGPTVKGGWITTQQLFDNWGITIQKSWKTMLAYGTIGGVVYTWTGSIYMGLMNKEVTWFTGHVDHVLGIVSSHLWGALHFVQTLPTETLHGIQKGVEFCTSLLVGK
jgi:hypothetical protein